VNRNTIGRARALILGATAALGMMGLVPGMAADTAPVAKPPSLSNKWRVEFDGRAHTGGEIIFAISLDGVTTNITTTIPKGEGENAVAKLVRDQLRLQAPANHFHIETDDGEDVLVKKKFGTGTDNFGLQLVSSSVTGILIDIEKE